MGFMKLVHILLHMVNMLGQATWIQLNLNSYLCVRFIINYKKKGRLKALVWFWLIDETISANLVYQSDYEIGSTTPSDEAMAKIMTTVMAWC